MYIPYFQRGSPPSDGIDKGTNQPHIVCFVDSDSDIAPQIFIAIEGHLVIECENLPSAIYSMVAAHYVFDIQYNPRVNDVQLYLQEQVLGVADPLLKKSALYSSVISGIACNLDTDSDGKLIIKCKNGLGINTDFPAGGNESDELF